MRFAQAVLAYPRKNSLHMLQKTNQRGFGMILSNNNKYVSKCYLKFFKIVLAKIGSV